MDRRGLGQGANEGGRPGRWAVDGHSKAIGTWQGRRRVGVREYPRLGEVDQLPLVFRVVGFFFFQQPAILFFLRFEKAAVPDCISPEYKDMRLLSWFSSGLGRRVEELLLEKTRRNALRRVDDTFEGR